MNTETGTILQSGNWMNTTIWEIVSNTGKTVELAKLEWSKDILNEAGCMYRTAVRIRVKLRAGCNLRKRGYGTFRVRETHILVLETQESKRE